MKNAHERFGRLGFTKRLKDTTTEIHLHLERFIGEVEGDGRARQAHLISVIGGDSDVAAAWAAVMEGSYFSIEGQDLGRVVASLGKDARCFRGSITLPGRKRPIRHLVAVFAELAQTAGERNVNRTILCDKDPVFVFRRLAQRFGLPVVAEWAGWFMQELHRRNAIY